MSARAVLNSIMSRNRARVATLEVEGAAAPPAATGQSLEDNFRKADAAWKRDIQTLEKLQAEFQEKKLTCSNNQYTKLLDDISYQQMLIENSHREMSEALRALEAYQFEQGKIYQLEQKKKELVLLNAQMKDCDTELFEIISQENSLPQKRLQIQGRRQDLWRQYSEVLNQVREAESAHS